MKFNELRIVYRRGGNTRFAVAYGKDDLFITFALTGEQLSVLRSELGAGDIDRVSRTASDHSATYLVAGNSFASLLNPPSFGGLGVVNLAKASDGRWYASIGGDDGWMLVDDRDKLAKLRMKRNGGGAFDSSFAFETPNDFCSLLADVEPEPIEPVATVVPDGYGLIDEDGFVDDGVFIGKRWGVMFIGESDEQVGEILWLGLDDEGVDAVDEFFTRSKENDGEEWPDDAVRIIDCSKDAFRRPIYGIDYGAGSVKRRFKGMRVPRRTYQYRSQ